MNTPDNTAATQRVAPAGDTRPEPLARGAAQTVDEFVELLDLADIAVVHAGRPQVQGDVLVLPWPAQAAAAGRARAVRAASPVPRAGRVLIRSWGRGGHAHTVLPDGPNVRIAPDEYGRGLGVLVVGERSVAVLAHEEHPDLHIGEGVYILRRQRRYTPEQPETVTEYVED